MIRVRWLALLLAGGAGCKSAQTAPDAPAGAPPPASPPASEVSSAPAPAGEGAKREKVEREGVTPRDVQLDATEGDASLVRWQVITPFPASNDDIVRPTANAGVIEDQQAADRPREPPAAAKVPIADFLPPAPKPGPLAEPIPADHAGYPADLAKLAMPSDNPQTSDKVALGKKLFFDARLSADGTVSCATCHDPEKGFADALPTSIGIGKQLGQRNAPTVLNAALAETQFWDGRAPTLEEQAKLPITNPIEMGQKAPEDAMKAIAGDATYQAEFQKTFGRAPNFEDVARAIAAYERTLIALDARFDRFLAGDEKALTAQERRGWTLFNGKGNCMSCHALNRTQPLGIDGKFHNIGVAARKQDFVQLARDGLQHVLKGDLETVDRMALETKFSELGRFLVTKQQNDIGAFKTMPLRNVAVTAPYFHDGSAPTLWDVMDHYNKGGEQNPFLDSGMERLGLSEAEIDDLVAFMGALTSQRFEAQAKGAMARQRALSRTKRPLRDTAVALGKNTEGPGVKGPFGDLHPESRAKDAAEIGGRMGGAR